MFTLKFSYKADPAAISSKRDLTGLETLLGGFVFLSPFSSLTSQDTYMFYDLSEVRTLGNVSVTHN